MSDWQVRCGYCQTSGDGMLRCSRCYDIYYCSKACQRLDWPQHRQHCTVKASNQNDVDICNGVTEASKVKLEAKSNVLAMENKTGSCRMCEKTGCTTKCSRCKKVFYCSRKCQKENWTLHKTTCSKNEEVKEALHVTEYTGSELKVLQYRQEKYEEKKSQGERWSGNSRQSFFFHSAIWNPMRFFQVPSPEKLAIFERPKPGSLEKAVQYIKAMLPKWNIILRFDEVPHEIFTFFPYMVSEDRVLVAFMFMYHHHAMRHGVYLKDADDKILHVEFYLDHHFDDPRPFFTYEQVRPGGYIFIKNPVKHTFGDGIIGFRINEPWEVLFQA